MRNLDDAVGATDWVGAIDHALFVPGAIRLAFQPIVDLQRATVAGYEVLARFAVPGVPGSPLPWLSAARDQGRLASLEQTILVQALQARRSLPPAVFLSVNLSAGVLLEPTTAALFAGAGDLRGVVVEITEHDRELDGWLVAEGIGRPGTSTRSSRSTCRSARCTTSAARSSSAPTCPVEVVSQLRDVPRRVRDGRTVRSLVREVVTRPAAAGWDVAVTLDREEAGRRPGGLAGAWGAEEPSHRPADDAGPSGSDAVVLVDEHGTPVGLELDGHPAAWGPRPMSVMAGESVAAVALRCAGRPSGERLKPVVCCDERGRVLGLITVDALLHALAREQVAATSG